MKAIEELRAEHEGIRTMLAVVRSACGRGESAEPAERADLERMVEFLRVFADRCHHAKEEDLLFPALEAAGVAREGGPIGVMLAEHARGRELIRAMEDALEGWAGDPNGARHRFAAAARAYASLLEQHIEKEQGVLFAMAERVLTPEQDAILYEGFEAIERDRIGPGKHQEYHALMDALARKYP